MTRPRASAPALRRLTAWTLLGVFGATLPGSPAAWAANQAELTHGEGSVQVDGDHIRVDTTTPTSIFEWKDGLHVVPDGSMEIHQHAGPDSRSLHRSMEVIDIEGLVWSNAKVYLVSPAGVFFGDQAVVDVSGLVAGAGEISNDDFLNGVDRITGVAGDVKVAAGADLYATGDVALVGRRVENFGSIRSEGGMIALVAGESAVLSQLDGHLRVRVDGAASEGPGGQDFALVQGGEVDAGGGRVSLTSGDTWSLAMNHTGITRAREIELHAQGDGLVQVAGTLDARGGAGETGGRIHVTGQDLSVQGTLDASGDAGGGEIRVGGDVRGEGALRQARRTLVGRDAALRADAGTQGDGGSIVVFAQEKTGFYGSASARGGAEGGDGGFVELSGKRSLDARGEVVLTAENGRAGTLLFDPNRIEIQGGGPADGDDDDASLPDGTDADDFFSGVIGDDELFTIHESEIEGTEANIILIATNEIYVDGTFDHPSGAGETNAVVLKPGYSLEMRTEGTTADNVGIDLTRVDSGEASDVDADGPDGDNANLTWKVSEGGTIFLETAATADDADAADIRVGHLVWDGRAYDPPNADDPALPRVGKDATTPPTADDQTRYEIIVRTQRGDIEIGSITARGRDAATEEVVDGQTPHRTAEAGGDVLVEASQRGDLTIAGGIDTSGGDAGVEGLVDGELQTLAGDGGRAGRFRAVANDGGIVVEGDAVLDGGDGWFGERGGVPFRGFGGEGGLFELEADAVVDAEGEVAAGAGEIALRGDVSARGGTGQGYGIFPEIGGVLVGTGQGGRGGRIFLSGLRGVVVDGGEAASGIELDASGGNGSGTGGDAWDNVAHKGFAIVIQATEPVAATPPPEGSEEPAHDVVIRNANLVANGGDAGVGVDGTGGAGGAGGAIVVGSANGHVVADGAADVDGTAAPGLAPTFTANGGRGGYTVDGESPPPGDGGAGGSMVITANRDVRVGDIVANGGEGENTTAGAGGRATLTAARGDVYAAGIEASGGNVTGTLALSEDAAGGIGGAIALSASVETDEDGNLVSDTGGNVRLAGELRAEAGQGRTAEGEAFLDDEGELVPDGTVGITAVRDVSVVEGSAGGIRARNTTVTAETIGGDPDADTGLAPLQVGGTGARNDLAELQAKGRLLASVVQSDGERLERFEARQQDVGADTIVYDAADVDLLTELLHVVGDEGTRTQTVTHMKTVTETSAGEQAPHLIFRLDDRPPTPAAGEPAPVGATLVVEAGAVDVGPHGGAIIHRAEDDDANAGAIVGGAGADADVPHIRSAGDFRLEGRTVGEANDDDATDMEPPPQAPLVVAGTPDGTLFLEAEGRVNVEVTDAFGTVDVTQHAADGTTRIAGLADDPLRDAVVEEGDGSSTTQPVQELVVETRDGIGFAYRLAAPAANEPDAEAPQLDVKHLHIGGTGVLESSGDLRILAPGDESATIALDHDHDLLLDADGDITAVAPGAGKFAIDLGANPAEGGEDTSDLVVASGGGFGEADAPVVTRNVDRVAASVGRAATAKRPTRGDFHLENRETERLEIARIAGPDPFDVQDLDEGNPGPLTGILADADSEGDMTLVNADGRIVLGEIPAASLDTGHVQSNGSLRIEATSLEIGNAQYAAPDAANPNEDPDAELVASNRAELFAVDDLVIAAPIDTAAAGDGATAVDTRTEEERDGEPALPDVERVAGSLVMRSRDGRVVLEGHGGNRNIGATPDGALSRLETSGVRLEGDVSIHANELLIGGRLDGPGTATLRGFDGLDADADGRTRITFAGDVGTLTRLAGLDVDADLIRFSDGAGASANRVAVAGDVHLNAERTRVPVPSAATITDQAGGLQLEISGEGSELEVGEREKIAVTGNLGIAAPRVRVGDVSADRLRIDSPQIEIVRRESGAVLLPNGETVSDAGVDLVANEMVFSSTPVSVPPSAGADPGGPVRLYLGSGGLVLPGSVEGFEISRYTPDLRAVEPGDFRGPDGRVLDLTGRGGHFAGDPSRQLERAEPLRVPDVPAVARGGAPAAAAHVSADQVLAFLRCASATQPCAPADALGSSSLATPRAREITARYRDLVAAPGAGERLRAVFAEAGRAYAARQEWRDGGFDGASFYRFLEAAGEPAASARSAVRELAWLFAEIRMLGLDDADTRRLQRTLAQEFAAAAGIPGFGAEQVRAAVDATEVGLPEAQ